MKENPDQMSESAEEAGPSSGLMRQHDLLTGSPGVIDLRHPQQHYARTALWVAQRFPLLQRMKDRYDTGDGSGAEGQAFVMKHSLNERSDDFSSASHPFSSAAQILSTAARSSPLAARHQSPPEAHAARLLSPSAESSTPTAMLRISRRPSRPALNSDATVLKSDATVLKSDATAMPHVSPGEASPAAVRGAAQPEASTASPVVNDLKSGAAAPPAERAVISKTAEAPERPFVSKAAESPERAVISKAAEAPERVVGLKVTETPVQPNDLPAKHADSRAVENELPPSQTTADQKQNQPPIRSELRGTNSVEIKTAAGQPGQSPPSLILTKRIKERASDESNSGAAESGTTERVARSVADPAGGADISSRNLSTPASPVAQSSASLTETVPGTNPNSATPVPVVRVSGKTSPPMVNRSGSEHVPTSQAQEELVLRKASTVEDVELREDALSSAMSGKTQANMSDQAQATMSAQTQAMMSGKTQDAVHGAMTGDQVEAIKASPSAGELPKSSALASPASSASASPSGSTTTLPLPQLVNQPPAPLRIQRSAQGHQPARGNQPAQGNQAGASLFREKSAINKNSSQPVVPVVPVVAAEIGENQARPVDAAIIWRKSANGSATGEFGMAGATGSVPRIARQADDSASAVGFSQSDQTVAPQAPAEQAQEDEIDVGQITRQVIRSLSRRLAVERERRGIIK
jgi:hypothetical protein